MTPHVAAPGARGGRLPEGVRHGVATGVLGGFTTYSTVNYETLALAKGSGGWPQASLYVCATVGGCLLAGFIGWSVARVAIGR